MSEQCSELFADVFDGHSGHAVMTCACGKTYFDGYNSALGWEKGELEGLRTKADLHPDKYEELDCSVGEININGVVIVYNCSCDIAKQYENLLVNNAERIAEYVNRRAKSLREKADKIEVDINEKQEK